MAIRRSVKWCKWCGKDLSRYQLEFCNNVCHISYLEDTGQDWLISICPQIISSPKAKVGSFQ